MVAAASLTLGAVHLLIWSRQRLAMVHLLFASMAFGAAGCGMVEIMLIHSTSIAHYHFWVRWQHVPVFLLLVSMVWLVHFYFGTGRRWLAWAI